MIAHYTGQPLAPGMIVCRQSMMTNGFAARPVTIVRVSGSRATVRDADGDERRIGLSTIRFIVDSVEEGVALQHASADFLRSEQEIEKAHLAARADRKRAAIRDALARATGAQS